MGRTRIFVGICALAVLAGCGGGGGGSAAPGGGNPGGAVDMTAFYGRNPLTGTVYQHQPGVTQFQYVTLTPGPPATAVPEIVDDHDLLVPGPVTVLVQSSTDFRASLPINTGITVGRHQGTITLRLYRDATRTSQYTLANPSFPYDFTVTPLATAEFRVDGIAQAPASQGITTQGARLYVVALHAGQTLQVDTSRSFNTWNPLMGGGPACTVLPGCTSSCWKATLGLANPGDTMETGTLYAQDSGTGETVEVDIQVRP